MQDSHFKIALAGNPNSGKTSLFNQLTGLRQKVANYPGITVEKKTALLTLGNKKVRLVDLPGNYSLHPNREDEKISLQILTNPKSEDYPDAIIYVADSTELEKQMLLFTQLIDLGFPMLLVLNMSDIADRKNIVIDPSILQKAFGVPVILLSSRSGKDIEALKVEMVALCESVQTPQPFYKPGEKELSVTKAIQASNGVANDYMALLYAHHYDDLPFLDSTYTEKLKELGKTHGFNPLKFQIEETLARYDQFVPIIERATKSQEERPEGWTGRLDRILTHRFIGPFIFFIAMLLVFQAIYAWAAYPMEWIETLFGWANTGIEQTLPQSWFRNLITDGLLAGLGGIMIFIPQIAILFILITILDEIGYMARAVYLFDNLMRKFGLNGRSIVALVSGAACAIPAVMSTRTITNWRERMITILVTPFITCSARIPVFIVLIGFIVPPVTIGGVLNLQGLAFMAFYLVGIGTALSAAWVLKKILKTRQNSFLLQEMPNYRMPDFRQVILTTWDKVKSFIVEAGKIILMISLVLWFLGSYGPTRAMEEAEQTAMAAAQEQGLSEQQTNDLIAANKLEASFAGILGKTIEPVIKPLGYDWKIGIAVICSFAAREVFVGTMATLYSIGSTDDEASIHNRMAKEVNPVTGKPVYSVATSLSLLLFYLFAMQCMSTLAVVRRETGSWKWPIYQFVGMTGLAYLVSLTAYQLLA